MSHLLYFPIFPPGCFRASVLGFCISPLFLLITRGDDVLCSTKDGGGRVSQISQNVFYNRCHLQSSVFKRPGHLMSAYLPKIRTFGSIDRVKRPVQIGSRNNVRGARSEARRRLVMENASTSLIWSDCWTSWRSFLLVYFKMSVRSWKTIQNPPISSASETWFESPH